MSAGNRRFPPVALMLILCVIAATTIMTAAAESTDSVTITILDGADRTYDFRDLEYGDTPIAIALYNSGNSSASIKVDIVTNLSDTERSPLHFTLDNNSLPEEVKIPSHEVRFLAFRLNRTDLDGDQFQPGLYKGFIVLTNQTNTTIGFTLAVPSLAQQGPASFDIKIPDSSTPLKVEYDSLVRNGRIAVGIENTGKQTLNLTGTIILGNLVDSKGSPVLQTFPSENEAGNVTPVSFMVGDAGFLYFNLTLNETPRRGNYPGFIVVTAEQEGLSRRAPLTLFVPSETGAGLNTFVPYVKERVQDTLKKNSANYLNEELVLSDDALVATVVILLAVGVWGIRTLYKWKKRSEPGPVTIDPIKNASEAQGINIEGLSALMKDELENVGLLPPATKPYETLTTVMESLSAAVPGAPSKIGTLLKVLLSLIRPQTGHQVMCTLRNKKDPSGYSLICEIIGEDTKKIEKIDVAEGTSADEAVKKGAVLIYQYIVNEHPYVMEKVPPWALFSSSDSLELYQEGIQLEKENARERKNTPAQKVSTGNEASQRRSEALEKYKRAAGLDPNNILIRLAVIKYMEGRQFLDAVLEYLKLVTLWPVLLEPRYRLAVSLTFIDELIEECKNPGMGSQRRDLATLLKNSINDEEDYTFGRLIDQEKRKELIATLENLEQAGGVFSHEDELKLKECFLVLAHGQYHYLEKESGWWRCLGKRLYLIRTLPYERKYNPCWKYPDLKKFSKVVHVAHSCARIRYEFIRETADDKKRDSLPSHTGLKKCSNVVRLARCRARILYEFIRGTADGKKRDSLPSLQSEVACIVVPSRNEPWEVHYNAACFYALALNILTTYPQGAEQRTCIQSYATTAIRHLEQVIRDRNYPSRTWIFDEKNGDPDLKTLRKCHEFTLFALIGNPNPMGGKREDRTKSME